MAGIIILGVLGLVCMMPRILVYAAVMLVMLWGWFQWTHWRLLREARKLPVATRTWPILGHVQDTLYGVEEATRLAIIMQKNAHEKGYSTICFWCGPLPLIIVQGVDDIQKILNSSSTAEKASEYEYAKYALGEGLITATGQVWKITRRNINPLFHPRNLEQMMPVFNRNIREMVSSMSEHVGHGQFDVKESTMNTALKTICNLIFGPEIDFDVKSEEFLSLKHVAEKIPEIAFKRVFLLWLRIDAVFNFLYREELKEIDKLWKKFTEAPLKKTIANNARKKTVLINEGETDINTNDEGNFTEGPLNLIQIYSDIQKRFPQITEKDLKAEMVTFYASVSKTARKGTDTVGLTVANCLLALGKHQQIQERLVQEISLVIGSEEEVTSHDIDQMPYLDQVYKETLRWSLILPYIARRTTEDVKLSTCNIPAGSTVVVCLMGIHLDPKVYPNPEKFNPENFSAENCKGRHKCSFLPLSGGPRACIGKRYAELWVKTALIQVLRKYRVTTDMDLDNRKRKLAMVLVATEGYNIELHHRN